MSTDVGIEIVGLEALEAKLSALSEAVRGAKIEAALKSGALLIEGPAKKKAPKLTGNLARSIHTETSSSDTTAEARIGTNVIYAAIQEFGGTIKAKTGPFLWFKNEKGKLICVRSVDIPAQPYLRPAFDENKNAAVREIGDALRVLIEEAAS